MKKLSILLFIATLALVPFTPQKAQAVDLGPFKVGKDFCEQIQQLTPILNSYSMIQWPVVGFPGITLGVAQNTSALLDLCNFIMQIEQLNTQDAIFFTGSYLNKLTDNKWEHHLEMADKTWNLANTVYDFESGGMREGALSSASTHRDINDYMSTSYGWYNKTFNSKDAQLKNRGQREQDMNAFAQTAYSRAILKEAINCPTPAGNKNYEKIYATEIQIWEPKRDDAKDDMDFYRARLYDMGPRFMNTQADLSEYTRLIEKLITNGVDYQTTVKKKTETTYKPGPVDKTSGKPSQKAVSISTDTQVFAARQFPDMFNDFRSKYNDDWSSWVTAQFLSQGSQGLLNDPRGKVEDEFRDLAYECNPTKLMRGVDFNRPDYQKLTDERTEKCREDVKMNQKKAENLLNYYVQQLQNSLFAYKNANANIWTKESWYLGTNRAVNTKDSTAGYQQEEVTCKANLQPAEMQKLGLKQQQVENEYAEQTTKELMKQNAMLESQAQAQKSVGEELGKRQKFAQSQKAKNSQALGKQVAPTAVPGGI